MKKFLKRLTYTTITIVALITIYVMYVFLSYYRIEDNLPVNIEKSNLISNSLTVPIQKKLKATTYNIGFGAYSPDFSFFMDGGKYSRAKSASSVTELTKGAGNLVKNLDSDFALFQEVDIKGTRSHHVNQYEILKEELKSSYSLFALNYDSPYLFYPFLSPHGKNKSSIALFSDYEMVDALRVSLPISKNLSFLIDLDRAYTKTYFVTEKGNKLVIYNTHLSAYTNEESVRNLQVQKMFSDMQEEYDNGNYVICGGDFNRDLKIENESEKSNYSWAFPLERTLLGKNFSVAIDILSKEDKKMHWNSARNADISYEAGKTFTVTLDGFVISDNIEILSYKVENTGYSFSDHENVSIEFRLK